MPRARSRAPAVPTITLQPVPADQRDAFHELVARAKGRTGRLSHEHVARHALRVTPGGDGPVREAALEAILRRFRAAESEALRVFPSARHGDFRVAGAQGTRPYGIVVSALEPLQASCDCRDFARNALGLCKHVAAVLLAGHAPPTRALRSGRLEWDSVRPLTGAGDALERLRFRPGTARAPRETTRLFRDAGDGHLALAPLPTLDRPRLNVIQTLLAHRHRTPAATALLEHERARLERRLADAPLATKAEKLVRGLLRPLYPYQLDGVRRFLADGRLLLADDMGLGKSAQAIAGCVALWNADRVRRGLLVVPAALKPQWLREWRSFTNVPAAALEGRPVERAQLLRATTAGFVFAGYEQVVRDLELLRKWNPDVVVLDEAQRIKNWQTKTALSVKQLAAPWRLVLTGTPMENRLDELASLLDFVDDRALEPKWRLGPWHSTPGEGRREVTGARHLDTLRTRLEPALLRRRKQEVLAQLPSRTVTRVPTELTTPQRDAHEELSSPIQQLVARARHRPLTQPEFLRLMSLLTTQRIICNGLALRDFTDVWPTLPAQASDDAIARLDSPKLAEVRELVARLAVDQGRKVVVFSQWRRMLKLAAWATSDLLAASNVRAGWFTGGESPDVRTRHVADFHDDPGMRILFCSDAGGVGLNLQKAAHCVINLELPWNPAVLEQRIGRVWRLGQGSPVEVFNVVAEHGIEARIAGLVADKKALFTGLFDGTTDSVTYEGSGAFLAKVEQLVGGAPAATATAADEEPLDPVTEPPVAIVSDDVPEPAPPPAAAPPPGPAEVLATVLAGLTITPNADGGVRIDAPPEAARLLADAFSTLALRLLASANRTPPA